MILFKVYDGPKNYFPMKQPSIDFLMLQLFVIQLFLVYTCYEKGILLLMPSNFECQVPTAISFWILYPSLTGTCCWSNLFWDFGNHSIHPLFLSFQMVIPDFMNSKEKNRLLMRTGTKRKWRSSGCWKAKRWKIIWAATIKMKQTLSCKNYLDQ